MKLLFDLHTHTVSSGHAYSTLNENLEVAYRRGLSAYGFSDHAQSLPGAPNNIYFKNFRVIPRKYKEMYVFAGVEANIIDYRGGLDIDEEVCKKVDYIVASLHTLCIRPGTKEQNTSAYLGAMQNPYVKIIGHPDDSRYPIDYDALVKGAKEHGVALEINNSSLHPLSARKGGRENILHLLRLCKKYGAYIVCNTDSHYCESVGEFTDTLRILEESEFPEDLVLNTRIENLSKVINIDI